MAHARPSPSLLFSPRLASPLTGHVSCRVPFAAVCGVQSPQFSREYLARLMATDSTHYLLLALVFLNETPVLCA